MTPGSRKRANWVWVTVLTVALVCAAFAFMIRLDWFSGKRSAAPLPDRAESSRLENMLAPVPVGFPAKDHPLVASVTIADLDKDGLEDVLVCDLLENRIGWIRQHPLGIYTEQWLGPALKVPVRVQAVDFDLDGDLDLLVAVIGQLLPTNNKIGSIVILENGGQQNFSPHVIADGIARVTDVRGGDMDGDGDIDLVVGQFGYNEGETRWMENLGHWKFKTHILQSLSGPIHTIPVDVDNDGDLDIVSLVSQEWEEIWVFENKGAGQFKSHLIWGSTNDDFGCSGMRLADLDRDGDVDILFTNGDAFDYTPPRPRPWHGVQWLENTGDFKFAYHRLGALNGASAACAVDLDNDGDTDVVAVSAWNLWEKPAAQSLVWFENDGIMNFIGHDLTNTPTHLITLEAADMDHDGRVDLVSGGMHFYPPYSHQSRVTLWRNVWPRPSDSNRK